MYPTKAGMLAPAANQAAEVAGQIGYTINDAEPGAGEAIESAAEAASVAALSGNAGAGEAAFIAVAASAAYAHASEATFSALFFTYGATISKMAGYEARSAVAAAAAEVADAKGQGKQIVPNAALWPQNEAVRRPLPGLERSLPYLMDELWLRMKLIPSPADQNPWAHCRSPMDMMRHG